MAKKRKKPPVGVPEWMVTFGDLMALLLTFFILLQMFSELKREVEYQRVVTAVKEAFGYQGGTGVTPTDDLPMKSIVEQLVAILRRFPAFNRHTSKGITAPRSCRSPRS